MSARQTKFPKNVIPARKVHQATTIVGKNGLVVDALATLEPGTILVKDSTTLTYSSPTITFNNAVDLSILESFSSSIAKHTGTLIFTDASDNTYFIDKNSIDNTTKTLNIYIGPDFANSPSTIDLGAGWRISEAELVNRLQTTTSAVVDSVEFRDVEVSVDLDGSTVNIKDNDGDQLEINPDGSINVNVVSGAVDNTSIKSVFGEISSVSNATPTTIVTYTVPPNVKSFLQRVSVSGTNIAKYDVKVNGAVVDRIYTYFNGDISGEFNFTGPPSENGLELLPGDIVVVEVEHVRPSVGDFNSRIQILEVV